MRQAPGMPRRSCSPARPASNSFSSAPTDCSNEARAAWTVFSRRATSASAAIAGAPALGLVRLARSWRPDLLYVTEPREGHGASGFSAPAPPGEAPPEAPTRPRRRLRRSRLRCSAPPTRSGAEPSPRRPRPAGARARRAPGRRPPESAARPLAECGLERPSHPVVDRLRLGQGYESVGFLGTRHRPREQESADEHGDQHHAGLGDDAARQRAFRGRDPLLPAAHRSPSLGVNRQLARSSPIWSHPSPRTWRAM